MTATSGWKPVAKLVEMAALHPATALPVGTHQSLPIPVPHAWGLWMAFLYGRAEIVKPREGLQLWPPSYVAFLRADTGEFHELRSVRPEGFGQRHDPDQPLGPYLTVPQRQTPEFLTSLVQLYQALDHLLPWLAARSISATATPERTQVVAEFQSLFSRVAEAPWLPYYHSVGRDFFSWLESSRR